MAIGNQATYSTSSLNAELASIAQEMHDANARAMDFFERVNGLGIAGLTVIGFGVTDGQNFFTTANYLNTMAMLWFGQASQAASFNFDNATAIAR